MSSKIIGTALLLIGGFSVNAQEENNSNNIEAVPAGMGEPALEGVSPDKSKIDVTKIYVAVQNKPKPAFNMSKYLMENLKYPEQALKNEIQGKVIVQFVVERDGSLTNIKVIRGKELGHGIPEEVFRLVRAMPKWKPATLSGESVRAYFTMPIDFNLQ
ncbi:MAG: energy transducer TonB [Sphingobacteriales bacterium]|nr:MAG: energy transducer TonB [Sphingobacteriales bacterium]